MGTRVEKVAAEFGEGVYEYKLVCDTEPGLYRGDLTVMMGPTKRAYYFDSVEEAQDVSRPTYDEILAEVPEAEVPFRFIPIDIRSLVPRKTMIMTNLLPACICGGKKDGCLDYGAGHSDWCDVHESKRP